MLNGETGRTGDMALREQRQATGPVTVAGSLKHSLFCLKAEKKRCFCRFLLGSYYSKRLLPTPLPSTVLSSRSSGARAPRRAGLGPRRAALPGRNPSLVAPQSGGCSACLSPRGRLGRGCKNLGARSLACQEANCLHILQEQHPCLGRGRKRQNK